MIKVCTRNPSATATGIPAWLPLLLLLTVACSLVESVSSQVAKSVVDAYGEIENSDTSGSNIKNNMKTHLDLANAQFDWLRSKGGGVNRDKVVISADSNHNDGDLGLFAAEDIREGDLLMTIPASAILKVGA